MRKFMYGIKEMLYSELEEIAHKGNLSKTDLEDIDTIIHSIKNIMKICEMDSESATEYEEVKVFEHMTHDGDEIAEKIGKLLDSNRMSLDDKSTLRRTMEILRK